MRKLSIFIISLLIATTSLHSNYLNAEPGNPYPDIQVVDDIQTVNVYGSLAVQSVFFDEVLTRVTRTFRSSAGDTIVISYDPSNRTWLKMKTPDSHYMISKLNSTTYKLQDLLTGQSTQETHSGALPDFDMNVSSSTEPWFVALQNFIDYEGSANKSYNALKANAKTTSRNSCSQASDCGILRAATTVATAPAVTGVCGGGVFATLVTYGVTASAAAGTCFTTILASLAIVDSYMTDCVLCESYEEIDNINNDIIDGGTGSEGSTYNPSDSDFSDGNYTIKCLRRVWSVTGLWTYCAMWDIF